MFSTIYEVSLLIRNKIKTKITYTLKDVLCNVISQTCLFLRSNEWLMIYNKQQLRP